MIKLKNVTKKFKDEIILDKISVDFKKGNIYGIIGRNGCGKSVLFKTICGFMCPNSGKVVVNNVDIYDEKTFPNDLAALIENPKFLDNLTGFENLKLLAGINNLISDEQILNIMKRLGLLKYKDKLYKNYSLGTKQKLGISQVLMEDNNILIFDEPFSCLDDKSVNIVREIILEEKKKGKLIILASHVKEDIEILCDYVYRLSDGKLVKCDKSKIGKE